MTQQTTISRPQHDSRRRAHPTMPERWTADPLAPDAAGDDVVVTSSRRLLRMMVSAVDVGARFERERVPHDAAAWMLSPRAMFHDRPAIEACQEHRGYLRSTVMHGLSLGIDADPDDLDELLDDDASDPVDEGPRGLSIDAQPRLLSAWIDASEGRRPAIHFCAMVTDDPMAFARRLVERFGAAAAHAAEIEVGFDPTTARATAFISDAMSETLVLAAAAPASPFSRGLDVVVEQRFAA